MFSSPCRCAAVILRFGSFAVLARKAQTTLTHADKAAVADHEMVEGLDIEQFAGLHDLARDQYVFNIYMENHLTV